jgi:uncharacterized spore protein YtfJ
MALNKLFDTIQQARETANWEAAFGEPQKLEDRTIIPVAQVGYGFGLGFGSGTAPADEEDKPVSTGEGGGAGGGALVRPLGVIVVTPESVYFEEVRDEGKIAIFGIGMVTLSIFQVAKTLRAIFGRR